MTVVVGIAIEQCHAVIVASDNQILLICAVGIGVITGRSAKKTAVVGTRLPCVWQNLSLLALITGSDITDSPRRPDSLFVYHNFYSQSAIRYPVSGKFRGVSALKQYRPPPFATWAGAKFSKQA